MSESSLKQFQLYSEAMSLRNQETSKVVDESVSWITRSVVYIFFWSSTLLTFLYNSLDEMTLNLSGIHHLYAEL